MYIFATLLDKKLSDRYNSQKSIGQFVTILSVNKTRELMGALRSFFVYGRSASFFCVTGK
jgi:hypothetical protein